MPTIIKRDGKPIGIAESHNVGLAPLLWFHANVHSSSMDHALKHEGYSAEDVDEVNCHDVESLLASIAERIGLTMAARFVPFSLSRNAKPGKDGKVWRSLNWSVTVQRHGRAVLKTDYGQGMGHAPCANWSVATAYDKRLKREAEELESETGCAAWKLNDGVMASSKPIAPPSIGDVLQSLARDSDVIDAGGFEEWAGDYGYETDSREAERIYRACLATATKLRSSLGESTLAELRLAASFN